MRLKTLLVGLALAAVSVSAGAHISQYSTSMFGPLEAMPNNSPGVGVAVVTVDDHSFTMRVQAAFNGLLSPVQIAHIHCCTPTPGTATAGVATPLPSFPGFPAGVTFGFYDMTFDMTQASSYNPAFVTANGGTPGTAFSALLTGLGAGTSYFNIHTVQFGQGEIRGFLAPIPEPGAYAMMLAGLGVLGLVAARRGKLRT